MAVKSTVQEIKIAEAKGIKELPNIAIAIGTGNVNWDIEQEFNGQFTADTIDLGVTNVDDVVVKTDDEAVTFTENLDYTVDLGTGIVTRLVNGNIGSTQVLKITFYHSKQVSKQETALRAELGRKLPSRVEFVVFDVSGDIVTDNGTYSLSPGGAPTNQVLFETAISSDDAPGQVIRELGVFVDATYTGGVPAVGQTFIDAERS